MRRPPRARAGFTFIETLIASGILMSFTMVAVMWLSGGFDLWWTTNTQSDVRTRTAQTMQRLIAELQSGTRTSTTVPSPNLSIPAAPGNTSITFVLPADLDPADGNTTIVDAIGNIEWDTANPIQYTYNAGTKELRRVVGVQQTLLASDVSNIVFEDNSIDSTLSTREVRIRLTIQKTSPHQRTVSATSTEIVRLRN